MTDPLRSASDYELFLYTLAQQFPSVRRSALTFVRLAASLARVAGELHFDHNIRLVVRERLLYDRSPLTIDWYGYEVWLGEEKLFWYDSQPHPSEPDLQDTHPQTHPARYQTSSCSRAGDELLAPQPPGVDSRNRSPHPEQYHAVKPTRSQFLVHGPMGPEELTTYKWVAFGDGHVRP
jgi:hypothetical protein